MKLISKFIATFLFIITLSMAPMGLASAVDVLEPVCNESGATAANSEFCQGANDEANNRSIVYGNDSLLYQISQTLVFVIAAVSVIMVMIGGVRYITSAGDSNGVKAAKDTILYAVIGLIVALFAQVIVTFVLSRLL